MIKRSEIGSLGPITRLNHIFRETFQFKSNPSLQKRKPENGVLVGTVVIAAI